MKKNKKGFTLVELVIVIAVIAILAAVLLPTFAGIVQRAKLSAVTQRAEAVRKEVYAAYYDSIVDMKEVEIIVLNDRYTYTYTIGANGQFTGNPEKSDVNATLWEDLGATPNGIIDADEIENTVRYKLYGNDVLVKIPKNYTGGVAMHFGLNADITDLTPGTLGD